MELIKNCDLVNNNGTKLQKLFVNGQKLEIVWGKCLWLVVGEIKSV